MLRFSIFISLLCLPLAAVMAQSNEENLQPQNMAEKLLSSDQKLSVGGYGEVHYNQALDPDFRNNGNLDVHRLVMLFGYQFSKRVQFVSEIEYEHVSEVFVEQAFLQYKINQSINLRGGLLLIPMGIINEFHEPTAFNGVERPLIDNKISPTTWREIGFGMSGTLLPASLKYQVYLVNGFNGYDGSARFNGENGLRGGRQKGAESTISSPNFTGKVEYFGLRGLNLGVSAYVGKSQSALYEKLDKADEAALASADSSVVGITMLGLAARYQIAGLQLRGQYYYASLSNTDQYNVFTANAAGKPNDLGSSLAGYYLEGGYNVLRHVQNTQHELIPFIRYEHANTQNSMEPGFDASPSNEVNVITTGISWTLAKGAVVKADLQFSKSAFDTKASKTLNIGFGYMF